MLGIIADDFTGASDIASFLTENGLNTIQMNGVPLSPLTIDVDAIVISLKSRSNPSSEAIKQSLNALHYLQVNGCKQFYFKYCSTFDSTEKGNIGPVTDALLDELGEDLTIICPALPVNGRTIFNGYLFVGNVLLNESGMQDHPITPMKDANLVRLMNMQSRGKTGLINYTDLAKGSDFVKTRLCELKQQGFRYVVVDAVNDEQLVILAEAIENLKLVTGGSGLAAYMAKRISKEQKGKNVLLPTKQKTVVLSGSCSTMTNKQVAKYAEKAPHFYLDVEQSLSNEQYVDELAQWVIENLNNELAPMVYATVSAEKLKDIQTQFGASKASYAIEQTFAQLATKLKAVGVSNFIIAGGETSSVIVQQLGSIGFHIGKQIAPGVPWLKALDQDIFLALKSGNFGDEDFFAFAQGMFI